MADELRAEALDVMLRAAGRLAERITAGRILWIRPAEGGPVAEGMFPGGVPAHRDRAAVEVACRLAAAALARAAGAPLSGLVMGEALDGLGSEDRLRAVDTLAEWIGELGQIVVITGTDVVDRRPEAFDRAFELRAGTRSRSSASPRSLPTGVARIRLAGAVPKA